MKILSTCDELRAEISRLKREGRRIGLVPTMGALHAGHLSLVTLAKQSSDVVVMTVFVNPLQFNSKHDLEHYPRTLESDSVLAGEAGVDILFAPSHAEIYPVDGRENESRCCVKAGSMSSGLCGASRPGHFDGVVTVVSILFHLTEPALAVFGEKDFQQLRVIEEMVKDLHLSVRILPGPLVRDVDGLALSSRNARLSPQGRFQALYISKSLAKAQEIVSAGTDSVADLLNITTVNLEKAEGIEIEYLQVRDSDSLRMLETISAASPRGARLFVAANVEGVRLIDNVPLNTDGDARRGKK